MPLSYPPMLAVSQCAPQPSDEWCVCAAVALLICCCLRARKRRRRGAYSREPEIMKASTVGHAAGASRSHGVRDLTTVSTRLLAWHHSVAGTRLHRWQLLSHNGMSANCRRLCVQPIVRPQSSFRNDADGPSGALTYYRRKVPSASAIPSSTLLTRHRCSLQKCCVSQYWRTSCGPSVLL